MFGRLRMRPWEIERLTPAELALCLDDDLETRRPPHGGQDLGAWGVIDYARRWRSLTPQERLEQTRES